MDARIADFRLVGESATFMGLVDSRTAHARGHRYTTIRAALAATRPQSPQGLVPGVVISAALLDRRSTKVGVFTTAADVHKRRDYLNAQAKAGRQALKAIKAIKADFGF